MSRKKSLSCHNCCDSWTYFDVFDLSSPGIEQPTLCIPDERSTNCVTATAFKAQIMMALPVNLFTSFVGYIFISEKIKRLWNWNCAYVMKDSVIERNRFIFLRDLQWMCLLINHEELTFKSQSTALYHNRTNPSNTMDTWKDWSLIFKVATLSCDVINTFRKNVNFSIRIRHFNIPVCLFVLQTWNGYRILYKGHFGLACI